MIPKFRAWHKESKKMYEVANIQFANESNGQVVWVYLWPHSPDINNCQADRIELMQWTGLQDIDGKDIYLHDILSLDADNILKFKVGWDVETAAFQLQTLEGSRVSGFYFSAIGACPTRILGNIYENPELLQCST